MDKGTDWYEGTADAVRKNLRYLQQPGIDYVLILSGDQLYNMDFRDMIRTHKEAGADVTIASMPVDRSEAGALGVMRCDDSGRVTGFLEKPQTDEEIDLVRMEPSWIDQQGIESKGRDCLASMGIYLFDRDVLIDVLTKTDYQDFGREVFPAAIRSRKVQAHLFDGYWEDIGTIGAFYESNLSLALENPPFQLATPESPVFTRPRVLPPSRIDDAHISGSLIADGCRIGKGAVIENSVIGLRSVIGAGARVVDSVLMGADEYEASAGIQNDIGAGRPPIGIGDGSVIENAILDKNCRIGKNVQVVNAQGVETCDDKPECLIRDRISVVCKDAILPDGWKQ